METLTCFHVASIIFSVLTVIMRRTTVTYVTRKRVYKYGRGLRRMPTVRQSLNSNLSRLD